MIYFGRKKKYGNEKVKIDGVVFDSKREADRWADLRVLERAGEIDRLQRQVKFTLIPVQRDDKGKVKERECSYIADFVYYDEHGDRVVEDAKGYKTPEYKIKKKLMLFFFGIEIKEV